MIDRQPEPWETNTAAPFLTLTRAHGTVALSTLGDDRFLLEAAGEQQVVVGSSSARERARTLADELD